MMLARAVAQFGASTCLDKIGFKHVQAWLNALAEGRHTAGTPLGPGSQRHHLTNRPPSPVGRVGLPVMTSARISSASFARSETR